MLLSVMARGRINHENKEIPYADQFAFVNDEKLRMTLIAISDKWDEKTRDFIAKVYNDPKLAILYAQIRSSEVNVKPVGEAKRREVIKIPNRIVYDFLDTVLTDLYGPEWMQNDKALKHELVLPWYVIPIGKL